MFNLLNVVQFYLILIFNFYMVQNIKEGIKKNKSLLFFALALAILFGGMLFVSNTPGVEGRDQNPTVLFCVNNTPNGGFCSADSQCLSGSVCAGTTGSCTVSGVGTCQVVTVGDAQGGVLDGAPTGAGGGGGGRCTNFVPQPPSYLNASFSGNFAPSGSNSLNIVIPASPNNGSGNFHQAVVILSNQSPESTPNPLWWTSASKTGGEQTLVANFGPSSAYSSQPAPVSVKVAVRNFDDCQQIWSPSWVVSSEISQTVSGGGGGEIYSCTGTMPANTTLCPNDSSGLTQNTNYSLVSSCGVPKCEVTCGSGYEYVGGSCQLTVENIVENGNVFGFAWSDNIGWIKMNSCTDNDQDGIADAGCVASFGVNVDNSGVMGGPGMMSGHAWSDSLGWIKFGGQTGPAGGPNSGTAATLNILNSTTATINGWARVLTGDDTPGFDGWISLSSGSTGFYPTGNINGIAGLTYNRNTARIVGSAWGGEAVGWVRFSDPENNSHKVTYGVPAAFDYSLDVTPSAFSWTTPQNITKESDIELSLLSGKSEKVTLSKSMTFTAPGANETSTPSNPITSSFANGDNCEPPCKKIISINATANTTPGVYVITVSGNKNTTSSNEDTVTITVPSSIVATCKPIGNGFYTVNSPVEWTAEHLNGQDYSYIWSGSNELSGSAKVISKTYSTTGVKTASVAITDSANNSAIVNCSPSAVIIAKPIINEF
jgi:hypothetical protein